MTNQYEAELIDELEGIKHAVKIYRYKFNDCLKTINQEDQDISIALKDKISHMFKLFDRCLSDIENKAS